MVAVSMMEAFNAGVKAGNESMHAAGRTSWAQEDYDAAQATALSLMRLAAEDVDAKTATAMRAVFSCLSGTRSSNPVAPEPLESWFPPA